MTFVAFSDVTAMEYDAAGEQTVTVQAASSSATATTYAGFNGDSEQTSSEDGNGKFTYTNYTSNGWVQSITDSDNNTTSYTYNGNGQVLTATDPNGHSTISTYDGAGQLKTVLDRDGRLRTYNYDDGGRLTNETQYSDNGVTVSDTLNYQYNTDNTLQSAGTNQGSYTYTYDGAVRLKTATDMHGLTLTYGYDANSNVTSEADSQGGTVRSQYNQDNLLQTRYFNGPNNSQGRVDFGYNQNLQLISMTRQANSNDTGSVGITQLSYDPTNTVLSEIEQEYSNTTAVQDFKYSYDNAERLGTREKTT